MILSSGLVHGFELTLPPSPAWTDLTRDLVATGVTPLDLGLDRFQDLLVLTDRVVSEMLELPGATTVRVSFSIAGDALEMIVEATGADEAPSQISELALSVLADEHWHTITENGVTAGFSLIAHV